MRILRRPALRPLAPASAHGHAHGPGHFSAPERFVPQWNAPTRDAWQQPAEIVAAAGLRAGDTAVDLGAGTGYLLPWLAAAVAPGGQVLALDAEPAMCAFLDAAIARAGWSGVRTHPAHPADPLLPAESGDAVVALEVWHHLEDRRTYAARLLQALRPGGVLVVVEARGTEGPPTALRLHTEGIAAELRAAGFAVAHLPAVLPRHDIVRGRRPVP